MSSTDERELHLSAVSELSQRVHPVDPEPDSVVQATASNHQFDNGLLQSGECVDIQSHGENKSFKFDKIISSNEPHKSGSASSTNKTSMILDICIIWMSALFFSMFVGISGIDMSYFGTALLLFVTVASCWIAKSAKYEFSVIKMLSTLRCVLSCHERKLFTVASKWVIFSALSVIIHILPVTIVKGDNNKMAYIKESDGVTNKPPKLSTTLNKSCEIVFKADSAASCSITDAGVYQKVLKDKITLEATDKIRPYGDNGRIEPLGKFTCTIESKGKFTKETCLWYLANVVICLV